MLASARLTRFPPWLLRVELDAPTAGRRPTGCWPPVEEGAYRQAQDDRLKYPRHVQGQGIHNGLLRDL